MALNLESKVPPGALVAIVAFLMWFVASKAPAFDFTFPAYAACSVAIGLSGALMCVAGVLSFLRAKTTVNPMRPESASALVTSGIYRHSRNPMYAGFALILLGWALLLSNALALSFVPAFVLYMNRFQIRPEERALFSLFGDEYRRYSADVRRWL